MDTPTTNASPNPNSNDSNTTKKSDRPKRLRPLAEHRAWNAADARHGGQLSARYDELTQLFPDLTPQELRIGVLVKFMYRSWQIAEILGCTEKTVENTRSSIRQKLALPREQNLITYLIRV